jgi:hypothetical protein
VTLFLKARTVEPEDMVIANQHIPVPMNMYKKQEVLGSGVFYVVQANNI